MSDFLEVLLRSQFATTQIGRFTQFRITKMQKINTIRYFCCGKNR